MIVVQHPSKRRRRRMKKRSNSVARGDEE